MTKKEQERKKKVELRSERIYHSLGIKEKMAIQKCVNNGDSEQAIKLILGRLNIIDSLKLLVRGKYLIVDPDEGHIFAQDFKESLLNKFNK